MVRSLQRDEALGMLRRQENSARIVDADGVVGRRMEHEQRLVQIRDALDEVLFGDVRHEITADAEGASGQRHLDLTLLADRLEMLLEQAGDVTGVARRGDRHYRTRFGNRGCGRQDRRAAKAVSDQDRGRALRFPQRVSGGDKIRDVRGECGVGEFAVAAPQPGEIEAQYADPQRGQALGDAARRMNILAAGEAVREQRKGANLARRQVKERARAAARRNW